MEGMEGTTGAKLAGIDHLRQSIRDILTTRIGTRVMRRDYGSDLPGLVDRPMSPGLRVEIFAATARALRRWEPRVRVERIAVANAVADASPSNSWSGISRTAGPSPSTASPWSSA